MDIIKQFKKIDSSQLLVVSDFDRTLTHAFVDGKVTALISVMVREHMFDADYANKAKAAYEKYRPIEIDESLSLEYRTQKMQEWWEYSCEVLIDKGLSKDKLRTAIAKTKHYLRNGATEFLTKLYQKNIPLVILSAGGLGKESIQLFLETNKIYFPNIEIFCNEFVWNTDGVATDYIRPLIHVFNKDFQLIKNSKYYKSIEHRKNIIAIGDNISDLDMVKNCEYKQLLKIGFLNENIDKLRPNYQKAFDVVIENDGPMNYLSDLIDQIS